MMRWFLPVLMAAGLLISASGQAYALVGQYATVSLTSISGYAGHAFVYAEVSEAGTWPAPPGSGFASPYYSRWKPFTVFGPNCPWLWAVYVYDRASNVQLNPSAPGTPAPNFQTSTVFCPSAAATPIGTPLLDIAKARLDLDLHVALSPNPPTAGAPAVLSGVLTGSFQDDLTLYLSMAIEDWSVTGWRVDFGDGLTASLPGGQTSVSQFHIYGSPGLYEPSIEATIAGHAQAAIFAPSGRPYLVRRRFTVIVGNSLDALAGSPPRRVYVPPQVVALVSPAIDGMTLPGPLAFAHVDALRGGLIDFAIRPHITREGYLLIDGVRAGAGRSTFVAWRYAGPPSDAPPGAGTTPGMTHQASDLLQLQWNAPDRMGGGRAHDYSVPLILYVRTQYADGRVLIARLPASFAVTVDFAALNW